MLRKLFPLFLLLNSTTLLASVSHDLRTPLTRLKLELALARPSRQVTAIGRSPW